MNRSERIIEIKRIANALTSSREFLEVQDECIQIGFANVPQAAKAYRELLQKVVQEQVRCRHLVGNPLLRQEINPQMETIRRRGLQSGRISFDDVLVKKLSQEIPLAYNQVLGEMRGYIRALAMVNYYESDLVVDGHFAQTRNKDVGRTIFSTNVSVSNDRLARLSEKAKVYLENVV